MNKKENEMSEEINVNAASDEGNGPESGTGKIELWNPNAAANWSLLFTPIFGAWLQAKNWMALNEPERAKKSMCWVYAGFVFIVAILFLPDEIGSLPAVIFILAWYFSTGRKQAKFVKEKGLACKKKNILKPIGIGIGGLVAYLLVAVLLSSDAPPEGIVENAIMENHYEFTLYSHKLTGYDVTNSYTKERDGETFHIIEYSGHSEPIDPGKSMRKAGSITGAVVVVKRGNAWYHIK